MKKGFIQGNISKYYGFYFIESDGIRYGYIGTQNEPVLFKQQKEKNGKTISRTRGLSIGCFWSNWN